MRLLERNDTGGVRLTKDLPTNKIPEYAILSHTWGDEEVLFRDLMDGTGKNKAGYAKIRFCGDQAWRDGLRFFWVDTCCIDKSNSVELQEAINSMFRWYRNATKCYTYLVDVSIPSPDVNNKSIWEPAFRASRWFTRGWTLQELIAPISIEFFSREEVRLGDRTTLEQVIHDVTGIPLKVLRGSLLSDFSVDERMAWIEKRTTTREEDMAYSLFGIFDVQLPLLYSEGKQKAFRRLREEIIKASKSESTLDEADTRWLAEHLQKVSDVSILLDKFCSKAKGDVEKARSDASIAGQHERDLKQNLKDDSLYDESSVAWKAIPEFEKLALSAGRKSVAWRETDGSSYATRMTQRQVQRIETRPVANAVSDVTAAVLDAVNAAQESLKLLDGIQCRAVEAKTLAKQGRMAESASLVNQVEEMSKQVEHEKKKAETAKKKAITYARDIYLTWQLVCEEHQRAICELEHKVDGRCAQAKLAANKARSDLGDAERYRHELEQNLSAADVYDILIGQITSQTRQTTAQAGALAARTKKVADAAAEVDMLLMHVSNAVQTAVKAEGKTQNWAGEAKTAAQEGRPADVLNLEIAIEDALQTAQKESDRAATIKEKIRILARNAYRECQSVCEAHRQGVNCVTNEVDEACMRGASLSGQAWAELGAAEGLETMAHALVANMVRDARTAHDVWLSDFYEELETARRRLGDYHGVVRQATNSVSSLVGVASELQASGAVTTDQASRLADAAKKTEDARRQLWALQQESERIRGEVEQFQQADATAGKGSVMEAKAAEGAAEILEEIAADVRDAAEAARKATDHAGKVRQWAADAKAAATLSGAEGAVAAIRELKGALQACKEQSELTVEKRKDVQGKMVQFAKDKYLCQKEGGSGQTPEHHGGPAI